MKKIAIATTAFQDNVCGPRSMSVSAFNSCSWIILSVVSVDFEVNREQTLHD
jgi:hypothetical protein